MRGGAFAGPARRGDPRLEYRRTSFLLVAAVATFAAVARAASGDGVSLNWQAPAACPDRTAVLERLRSLLQVSKAAADQVAARGTVTAEPGPGSFHLMLETVQGERTWRRTMDSSSCDELADAAALIIALVVDPQLMNGPPPGAEPPPSAAQPPPPPTAGPAPAPPPVLIAPPPLSAGGAGEVPGGFVARRSPFGFVAGAAAVADVGTLSRVSLGAEIATGVRFTRAQIEATGTLLPPVRKVIAHAPERGGDFWLASGGIRGCYFRPPAPTWGWGLCGRFEVGTVQGKGFGTSAFTATRDRFWAAGGLGAVATYTIQNSMGFRASLEGLVPVTRPEFVLENVDSVHKPGAVAGRLQLGLEAHFQ